MLQAHSFLWNYLWVAPSILLFILGFLAWKRGFSRQFPVFFVFTMLVPATHLANYLADIIPSVTAKTFWLIYWTSLLIEGALKFALVAEIFGNLFSSYASLARLSKTLIRAVGAVLLLTAALAAAYAPLDSRHGIISGAHLLEQTICLVEAGLLAFIFLFSNYFKLRLPRPILGIALGLSFSACVHLAAWALVANGHLSESVRSVINLFEMSSFHVCVLIWFYYLLVPQRLGNRPLVVKAPIQLPENNLALWNRELENLLHQ
jgi:hypothetical protein